VSTPTVIVVPCSRDELLALVKEAVRAERCEREPASATLPLVDRHEVARVLGVSAATVTRMQAEGMPHVFVGASPRYSLDDVRAWLVERGKQGTRAKDPKVPRHALPGVRLLSRSGR
jgi:hypothetical protein